ncbi:putative beta-lysine N-acetyltransferase [Fuchsiella alkaliacetigena]|uniref:putative beta-lysine N-acetyltransferase n=1 Tax=Fuchsiella alkaliacetigena TaxID=957042 RepID=UPI00200B9ACE|nr:putative beta-lysine N-acetyltransferase [Fuchsiella alkaliacetigena]MCK8825063.1 putative beta-lysine N-acetyltransferase [Fuchsiella alkaliacetigena]
MAVSSQQLEEEYSSTKLIRGLKYQAQLEYSQLNQRITIKSYSGSNLANLGNRLKIEAKLLGYGKVWVKARESDRAEFAKADFEFEARIPDFYLEQDALIMSAYLKRSRNQLLDRAEEEQIIRDLQSLRTELTEVELAAGHQFKIAGPEDADAMVELYNNVFDSYPNPIFAKEYIEKSLEDNLIYGLIYDDQQNLVAAASAETDPEYKNAEMTDFATLPSARGQGYASYLLNKLEEELKDREYHTFYSIARALSYGMNKVFKLADYQYTGRLIKNCHIAGQLEDMNLWFKILD